MVEAVGPARESPTPAQQRKFDYLREREFFRYFEPLGLPAFPSSVVPRGEIRIPKSSKDSALSAFAQLGALRLNARRATINLISKNAFYTIAEATKTISTQDDNVYEKGDQLQAGCSVRPTNQMFCRYIFDLVPSSTDPLDVRVVLGDQADERFRDEVPVSDFTPRFFCSVPLRTRNGNYIGTYCVFDDLHRDDLSSAHQAFLRDISKTISDHLELTVIRQEYRRGDKAVRGIGCFVEGKTSIRDWWLSTHKADRSEGAHHVTSDEGRINPEGEEDGDQQAMSRETVAQRQTQQTLEDIKDHTRPTRVSRCDTEPGSGPGLNKKSNSTASDGGEKLQEKLLLSTTKAMVSRAANILREAMEVQGVLFLDASIGTFGSNRATLHNDDPDATQVSTSGSENDLHRPHEIGNNSPANLPRERVECAVLGFSTSERSSINEKLASSEHTLAKSFCVPADFLKVLLRRYPLGKVFDLTADGTSSSSDSEDRPGLRTKPSPQGERKRKTFADTVDDERAIRRVLKRKQQKLSHIEKFRNIFPGARSLIFFPLWDAQKERFFAGAMAWTNHPARIFTIEGELNYFSAFSNTIMAEVSRLDTVKADRAKTDFIGSISHELRSPLHGILGSVELLQSGTTDAFQRNVIHTVETCSRTLLDTINHLLDFAKINNFTNSTENRNSRHGNSSSPGGKLGHNPTAGMISLVTDTDLSIVTEEVVESMFASHHAFMPQDGRPGNHSFDSLRGEYDMSRSGPKVTTILDIDHPSRNWLHSAPSGAWRRVLMNLYGNALKYTHSGFISVRVMTRPSIASGASRISIVVGDSGVGMSDDFQRSQMFTPFTQENPLLPGTGLGLSLCKQIVNSLGGSLKVNSRKGHGTEVKISVTVPHAKTLSDPGDRETVQLIKHVSNEMRGMKVVFQGFKSSEALDFANESGSVKAGAALHRTSIQRLCTDWFNLEVVECAETPKFDYIVVDSVDIAHRLILEGPTAETPPIIVICESPSIALAQWQEERRNGVKRVIEYICQPVGPYKLAQAFVSCQQRLSKGPGLESICSNTSFAPLRRRLSEETAVESKNHKSDLNIRTKFFGSFPGIDLIPSLSNGATSSCSSESSFNFGITIDPDSADPADKTQPPKNGTVGDDSKSNSAHHIPVTPTKPPYGEDAFNTPSPSTSTTSNDAAVAVLIVDDNPINLKLLSTFMSKIRVPYVTAENGLLAVQAYKRLRSSPPPGGNVSCVFMDINMPVMDGMTSTRQIRKYERENALTPTTIIALTGLASADAQQDAFTSGINLFLTKPVRLKEIRTLLDTI